MNLRRWKIEMDCKAIALIYSKNNSISKYHREGTFAMSLESFVVLHTCLTELSLFQIAEFTVIYNSLDLESVVSTG